MTTTSTYIVVGPVSIDGMTAQQPDIVAGFPAPTAVAGLGHKFALDLSAALGGIVKSGGAAVIVHDHSVMAGHVKLPLEDKAKIRANKGASILDEMRARVTVSLVFALEFMQDVQDAVLIEEAEKLVPAMYFGGGKVFPSIGGHRSKVLVAKGQDGLTSALYEIPAGFALLDRSDLLEASTENKDPLDALLDIIEFVPHDTGEGEPRYTRRLPGWLVPVFVGYQAIERRKVRSGLRHAAAIGHVFAESIYSVGEFRSLRGMLAKDPETLSSAFWKHRHNPQTETYFVSAAI
ncbi:hypothetical protein GOB57_09360 [Sinorhizobium meliloti]|nr:hypothetical protein [Sinorhizobium meliloti]